MTASTNVAEELTLREIVKILSQSASERYRPSDAAMTHEDALELCPEQRLAVEDAATAPNRCRASLELRLKYDASVRCSERRETVPLTMKKGVPTAPEVDWKNGR